MRILNGDVMNNNECFLENRYKGIDSFPVAMAYVPWQYWENIYDADKGFKCGTIFKDLNKPYTGCRRVGHR